MVRELRGAIAVLGAGVAIAVLPASASAVDATSEYHPDLDARSFVTSDGGWTGASSATGDCVPAVQCPEITNAFVDTGGTGGANDGHLRTTIGGLLGVAGESRAIWTSPAFAYAGAGGQPPTRIELTISRRTDIGALLSVIGNEADYSVELVDETAGIRLPVIDQASLSTTAGWTRSPLVSIDPSELTIGHSYRIEIISRFEYGAELITGGDLDYDDVILRAIRTEPEPPVPGPPGPPGPPGGSGGGDGGGGDGGGGGQGGGGNNPGGGSAIFDGRNLFIKLKCFGVKRNGKCRSRATALQSKKGKRYTFPIQRKVKAKKGKVVRARVRFRFRKQLERQRSVVLRSALTTSRRDSSKTIKFKKLKLVKRGS